jgi:hypothetical protein
MVQQDQVIIIIYIVVGGTVVVWGRGSNQMIPLPLISTGEGMNG